MAQQFNPAWLMMAQNKNPQDALAGVLPMPTAASVNAMSAQNAPTTPGVPQMPADQASQMTKTSVTQPGLTPQEQLEMQGLKKQLDDRMLISEQQQMAGINDYEKAANDYASQDTRLNFSPLSQLVADLTGQGKGVAQMLQANAPETPEEKRKQLNAMKVQLQNMKGSLSKDQLQFLKERLGVYEGKVKTELQEQRDSRRRQDDLDRLAGTQGRFNQRQLNDYGKQVRPLMAMNSAFKGIEDALGFNINEFDEATATVRGEKTDAPGVNVPLLGRLNQATPESRQFKSRLAALTNMVLKERSGAAVTTQEQARLMQEFANDRFKFNTEADMLAALKEFARRIENDIQDVGSGFDPDIPVIYEENQRGRRQNFKRESGAKSVDTPSDADIDKMSPAELKKYLGQ